MLTEGSDVLDCSCVATSTPPSLSAVPENRQHLHDATFERTDLRAWQQMYEGIKARGRFSTNGHCSVKPSLIVTSVTIHPSRAAGKYISCSQLQQVSQVSIRRASWIRDIANLTAFDFLLKMKYSTIALSLLLAGTSVAKQHGFLKDNGNGTWIIGNDVWNMTQERIYGSKLYYKDQELVGEATGHYVSYSKASSLWNLCIAHTSTRRSS